MTSPHPYYPPDLTFTVYIPNTHSPIVLIGAWLGALSFVTITTFVWLAPKKLSITERLITLWFVTSNHCLHGLTVRYWTSNRRLHSHHLWGFVIGLVVYQQAIYPSLHNRTLLSKSQDPRFFERYHISRMERICKVWFQIPFIRLLSSCHWNGHFGEVILSFILRHPAHSLSPHSMSGVPCVST